jgi:hypothetical protein
MTNQQLAEQQRLGEILKLARMQLNEEYMKSHSAAHTAWITTARTAWTSAGTLIPFTTKFVYPTEEEVVARGVTIYNSLMQNTAVPKPEVVSKPMDVAVAPPVAIEILQAGGDIVLAEIPEEIVCAEETADLITDVVAKEEVATAEPTVTDSLLENKFKSLFTKWGGRGNY